MALSYNTINKSFVSAINFMDKREILGKILDVRNEESCFMDVMEMFGTMKPTKAVTFHYHVNDELYALGQVNGAITSSTATNASPLAVVLDSNSMVRVGDIVLLPGAGGNSAVVRTAIVKSVNSNGTGITIASVDGANVALADDAQLAFFSGAYGEGSGYPTARRYSASQYSGQLQIFKDSFKITDVQWGSEVEVTFNGKPYVFKKAEYETALKFRSDISNALLLSEPTANTFGQTATITDANGNTVSTTRGLNSWITTQGGIVDTMGTTIDLSDWKRLNASLDAVRAPKNYLVLAGTSWNHKNDDLFLNLGGASATQLTTTGAQWNLSKDISLDLQSFQIYGRKFAKKTMDWFNHPNVVDYASAPTIADSAFYVPIDKIKTQDGGSEDRIAVRYLVGEDGSNTKYRVKVADGLKQGDNAIEEDSINVRYSATMGLQVLGTQHFVKQQIAP
jgi:hypothetical protein